MYEDLPDPNDQKKAEDILTQIGLHPVQQHLQRQFAMGGGPDAAPQPPATPAITGAAAPPPLVTGAATPQPLTPAAKMTLPGPNRGTSPIPAALHTPTPQEANSTAATTNAQQERDRLIKTGSGISQIKNPFLKGLARVGEIGRASCRERV